VGPYKHLTGLVANFVPQCYELTDSLLVVPAACRNNRRVIIPVVIFSEDVSVKPQQW
jgi:hypothetical protein